MMCHRLISVAGCTACRRDARVQGQTPPGEHATVQHPWWVMVPIPLGFHKPGYSAVVINRPHVGRGGPVRWHGAASCGVHLFFGQAMGWCGARAAMAAVVTRVQPGVSPKMQMAGAGS